MTSESQQPAGASVIRSQFVNHGSNFSRKARELAHLNGLVPPAFETLGQQVNRCITYFRTLQTGLEKYSYLNRIKNEDVDLFYKLVIEHMAEICPIIYTPTIGEVCQKFSFIYTPGFCEGLFLSIEYQDYIDEVLANWPHPAPEICVITDGSRILGLGDLGINGMGIPIGKLSLYVAAAGFHPARTLPITLDLGTNTEKYRNDPLYIGTRRARPADDEFFAFIDKVMVALKKRWPQLLVQFEDFSSEHAFDTLSRYKNRYFMFNDDIQGTGAVILAGFINAVRLSGIPLSQHRIVFLGAGSAGVGVASQLQEYIKKAGNLSHEESAKLFWLGDSKGLVTFDRGDTLPHHKTLFARSDNAGQQFKSLDEILDYVKPTCLIGLSSQGGAFTPEIIRKMGALNDKPIIFPLSNPSSNAECNFEQAMVHTEGRVLFASGTSFPSFPHPKTGKVIVPGQGNNMYIFPGLGLGAVVAKALHVTEEQIYQSAVTLSASLTEEEKQEQLLYPKLNRIRDISALIARDVILVALKEGLATDSEVLELYGASAGTVPSKDKHESPELAQKLLEIVQSRMYDPAKTHESELISGIRSPQSPVGPTSGFSAYIPKWLAKFLS